MQIVLLGTAAGGGFPQWNCWCPSCRIARADPARAHPRTQSSIAVSADGVRWFLINASPDVREQVGRIAGHTQSDGGEIRRVPIEGVIVTDAELDHTLGLLLLREARTLTLHTTDAVARVLERDSHILPTLRAFATVAVAPLPLDLVVPLMGAGGEPSGLSVEAFAVPGHAPRFSNGPAAGLTVGLLVRETARDRTLAYVPGCGTLDDDVVRRLRIADAVLFDGTCWTNDELPTLGISSSTASAMGHVAIGGPHGSLTTIAALPASLRVYTHINNTNPILIEDSAERHTIDAAGVIVGDDGMTFTI